jgi:ataxin-3
VSIQAQYCMCLCFPLLLFRCCLFRSKDYLDRVAEGSGNVDGSGNFSIEVLRSALQSHFGVSLPNIRQEGVNQIEPTTIDGLICHKDSHWFAIRKINGRYWNLNSTLDRPETISHFRLATEIAGLQSTGYTVFAVVDEGLPPPCTSISQQSRGLPQYWWKEQDLVDGKTNATTAATDPWRNAGSGMRLDGAQAVPNSLEGMTEDEMLAMALSASLQDVNAQPQQSWGGGDSAASDAAGFVVSLTPEPPASEGNAIRIQFRLPDGGRAVRRFLSSDNVAMLYAYIEDRCPGQGRLLELRAGFPPKDLTSRKRETMTEANMANETVQARYV